MPRLSQNFLTIMTTDTFYFSTQHPVNEPGSPNNDIPDKPAISVLELSFEPDALTSHSVDHVDGAQKVSVDVVLETGSEPQILEDIKTTHEVI